MPRARGFFFCPNLSPPTVYCGRSSWRYEVGPFSEDSCYCFLDLALRFFARANTERNDGFWPIRRARLICLIAAAAVIMRATKLGLAGATIRQRSLVARALVCTSRIRRLFAYPKARPYSKRDKPSAPKIPRSSSADVPKADPRILNLRAWVPPAQRQA